MSRTLLAVFAHPDDETFAIGGTLARLHSEGVHTALHVATDGAAGRASGIAAGGPAELARLRRAELLRAAAVLGVGRVVMPGHPDGELDRMSGDALVAGIVRSIRLVRPEVVVTFGPEGAPNRHRDHRAVSRAATAAFFLAGLSDAVPGLDEGSTPPPWSPARLYYFTWGETIRRGFGATGQPATCSVDVAAWRDVKRRAFEEHRTQWVHRDRFELTVEETESYFLVSGGGAAADSLFR